MINNMELTNDELIKGIIEEVKSKRTITFVEDDLFNTYLSAKGFERPHIGEPPSIFVYVDYNRLKVDLLKALDENNIYYITGPDDYIRMFSDKQMYYDYKLADEIRDEIDKLDHIIYSHKSTKEEITNSINKQFELFAEIRSLMSKWRP